MPPPFTVRPFSAENLFEQLSSHPLPRQLARSQRNTRANILPATSRKLGQKQLSPKNITLTEITLMIFLSFTSSVLSVTNTFASGYIFFPHLWMRHRLLIKNEAGTDGESFQKSYLGFTVARPLPGAVIGRTALITYPNDGGRRHYTALRAYKANFFGIELQVQSLAFQEQDKALAACATVALWSCFHKASELFQTPAPTPAEITRAANRLVNQVRPLPSHGLEVHQMCTRYPPYRSGA
jgi:hypothetical protein